MTEDEIEQLIIAIEDLLGDLNLDVVVAQERVLATEGEIKSGDDLGDRGDTISAIDSKRAGRPYQAGCNGGSVA